MASGALLLIALAMKIKNHNRFSGSQKEAMQKWLELDIHGLQVFSLERANENKNSCAYCAECER